MSAEQHPSVRALRDQPDLVQLKRQAKELLKAYSRGEARAVAEVNAHYHGAERATFALHDAQLVLARSYGFASWPRLKAFVDGVTVRRLAEAVCANDLATVRSMLASRPELVNLCVAESDEHRPLHYAVIERHPEMVRLLMQHGADPRSGIWPHRDATAPLVLARERGDDVIAAIMREAEADKNPALAATSDPAGIRRAFARGDEAAMIAALEAHPPLIQATDERGRTALHWSGVRLWLQLAAWLIDHGADVHARTHAGETAMDLLADGTDASAVDTPELVARLAGMLLARGAEPTARSAIVANDATWIRACHARGALASQRGLLTYTIRSDRPAMLDLLLELGLDQDESGKVEGLDEVVVTWGEPLRECAQSGRHAMAESLLQHGANPNTGVYAASSALSEAYQRKDASMIALLERHGARLDPAAVGLLGLTDHASRWLADDVAGLTATVLSSDTGIAQGLLWGAIEVGAVEIVRMALSRLDWPRDDSRWHGILQNGLYLGAETNRSSHLEGFQLALERADPNVLNPQGATLLHYLAAAHGGRTPADHITYATLLIDAGARLNIRDNVLRSTPLGWACRWGRVELVKLLLEKGADPVEADAEPWATPKAWAEKMQRHDLLGLLAGSAQTGPGLSR